MTVRGLGCCAGQHPIFCVVKDQVWELSSVLKEQRAEGILEEGIACANTLSVDGL